MNHSDIENYLELIGEEIDKLEMKCKSSSDPVNVFFSKIKPQLDMLSGNGNKIIANNSTA
jgi:hypothetical protein